MLLNIGFVIVRESEAKKRGYRAIKVSLSATIFRAFLFSGAHISFLILSLIQKQVFPYSKLLCYSSYQFQKLDTLPFQLLQINISTTETAKMQYRYSSLLTLVGVVTTVTAFPLNINMGAYSPALVVGDGAIGFKGTESVANIMNTLQGAAVNSATVNGAAAAVPAAAAPATGTAAEDVPVTAAGFPLEGMGKSVQTRQEDNLDIDDAEEALAGSAGDGDADDNVVKRALQDMDGSNAGEAVGKRDIPGFNPALKYASGALKSGSEVQLGTGEGGSGVGIIRRRVVPKPERRAMALRNL
jgi:hypothetical protein